MFFLFCQLLSDIASDWSSGMVVKIAVKIVVIASSSVTMFDIFYNNPEISLENVQNIAMIEEWSIEFFQSCHLSTSEINTAAFFRT